MHILKQAFLFTIGSLLINANYAQCPIGETEITIQFIEEGDYPGEVSWDYKVGDELSGSGPYTITDTITTCIPLGYLSIVGCDATGNTWNGAIFQVTLPNDSTAVCPYQPGCYIYTSTIEDSMNVPDCSANSEYEVTKISLGTCEGTPVIISGCMNPLALNFSICAMVDDGSCIVEIDNNNCINAQPINVTSSGECSLNQIGVDLTSNSLGKTPSCNADATVDAYYEFIVPNSGSIKYAANNYYPYGIALYKNCTGSSIFCSEYVYEEIIDGLTPGDTLILQIFNYFGYEFYGYSFCIEAIEPSLNNNCLDAELIEVAENGNCEMNTVNFYNLNYNSADVDPECNDNILYDAFYQFVAPANGQVLFSCDAYVGISLYSSCNEANLFCQDYTSFSVMGNLPVGDTLILQIFGDDYQSSDFNFCLEEATSTVNNDCSNPKFIEVDNNFAFTNDTLLLKYNTVNIEPNCGSAEQDAFYQFVVPQNGKILFSANQNVGISLYKSCDETSIYCKSKNHNDVEIEDLTPLDTLILQIFDNNAQEDILFSLQEAAPTFNDNCADAALINVASAGECDLNIINLNLNFNTLQSEPECETDVFADAYYQFVVPNSGSIRYYAPDAYTHGISLFNSCNDSLIVCEDYVYEKVVSGLAPGETLILQVFSWYESDYHSFCIEEVIPSANNNCLNAQPIEVAETDSCESHIVELLNFHYNAPNIEPECDESILYDAFYEFVVPPTGNILFACNYTVGISIYNSCDNTSLYCNNNLDYGVIGDLPVGETLILQIFEGYENSIDLNFCVEEVMRADNNNCSNAQLITVADTGNCEMQQVNVSNLPFNTPNIQPDCNDEILYDVYYKFVVPPSGQILFSTYDEVGIAFYNTCNNSSIVCYDYASFALINDLPVGDTLILQIYEDYFQEDFSFCLEDAEPSINDSCIDALPITVAQSGNCEMHQVNLSYLYYNAADIQPDCSYSALPDVFYEFMVPPTGSLSFSTDQNFGISILNSCTGEALLCDTSYPSRIIRNLPAGEMLTLQIFSNSYVPEISFCLEEVIPSTNNICMDALPITVAESGNCEAHQVSLSNFIYNSADIESGCNIEKPIDAFYEFVVPPSGQIYFSSDNNVGVAIHNNCDGQSIYCTNFAESEIIRNLPEGNTVILQIFESGNQSDLSFCVEEVAPSINNNCVNATPITVAESGNCEMHQVNVANLNYNSTNIEPTCDSEIYYDAFYEFIVPETGQISFSSDDNVGVAIYQSCNGISIFCEDNMQNEIIRNLPAGETVILQIFEDFNKPEFNFCLEESVPTLNNICINAEPFIVNEPGTCLGNYIQVPNTSNNTDINPYCASYVKADAFYSFIVPASGHLNISTTKQVGISIYDDCLEQSFYCNNQFSHQVIYGFNPGDTLILQAFQTDEPSYFELCLEDAPPSVNNNCANATALQIYNEGECDGNAVAVPFSNNSVNINPSCQSINADIFYKLSVPDNGQFRIKSDEDNRFGVSIYNTCNSNAIYCISYISDDHLIQELPPNEEVLLQLFQYNEPSDSEICIETAIPTPNNECANAIPIDVVPSNNIFETTDTINMKNNSVDISPFCNSIDQDAFYQFTVPQNGKIAINAIWRYGFAIYDGCGGENLYCDYGYDDIQIISDLPPNETLILQVFSEDEDNILLFTIAEVVDNDSCEKATLICEPSISGINLVPYKDLTYNNIIECNQYNEYIENSVWYSFKTNESGDSVSFEITKGECFNYSNIIASILSNTCENAPIVEDCMLVLNDEEKYILTLENPVAGQVYYLNISTDYYDEYCNFEINVTGGIVYDDCCQLDYALNTWCYYLNPNDYFVDVIINDLGQNPSGYLLTETGELLTSTGSTRVGPIPNGVYSITLEGLDLQDCTIAEVTNYDCSACAEHLRHRNANIDTNCQFNAAKTIESDVKVMPATSLKYFAGDSIILQQGFTIEKGAGFTIDIEDCE